MSVSASVTAALATRLGTVTTANGYDVNIAKVFYPTNNPDYQPMGSDLQPQEMPALIIYQGPVKVDPQHGLNSMYATYYVEIVQPWVPDSAMWAVVNALGRALWGGAKDATENSGYRFHPAVVEPKLVEVIPDFGMLQGHRIWVAVLLVHYRVRYTNL